MNASYFEKELRGHTVVLGLRFQTEPETGECDMTLDMAESEAEGSKTVTALFQGVSNLRLSEFGGGVTQLLCLMIRDIRDQQLDRLNFDITEAEHDRIAFRCRALQIVRRGTLAWAEWTRPDSAAQ